MKIVFIFLLLVMLLTVNASCCVSHDADAQKQLPSEINNTTKCNFSDERIFGINVSDVPYPGSESIQTNESFCSTNCLMQ
ncbi:nitrous oxide reductase accessory protein NosL [Methanomicrobium sp. W14]|nr:nitrous oxide reductase accessory protein NosL [Methanomicrobium sp. W14]